MLRLRPSELTLTSDDVEETFRRISLRQNSRASSKLPPRPYGQPGRLILKRGPQRSTRDAITALGDIPILQPQQAVFTSMDEDLEEIEDSHNNNEASTVRTSNAPDITSPIRQSPEEPTRTPGSPSLRTLHLPFRLERERRHRVTQSCPVEQHVGTPHTPPPESSGRALASSRGINDPIDSMSISPPSPSANSANSTPGLRGGGSPPGNDRSHPNQPDASNAPSPLNRAQRFSSPDHQEPSPDPTKSPDRSSESPPTLYLQGVFKDPDEEPKGIDYYFLERPMPQTEPRRSATRHAPVARSLSSGGIPSFRLPGQRPMPSASSEDDASRTVPAAEPSRGPRDGSSSFPRQQYPSSASSNSYNPCAESFQPGQQSAGSRRINSDASAASAGYSYYGSLTFSSYPSSERSVSGVQFDGTLSDNTPNVPRYRGNSSNMPDYGQHGPSPRPSSPYTSPHTRVQHDQASLHAPTDFRPGIPHGMAHNTSGAQTDAATAAAQGLHSPLDGISEQYQCGYCDPPAGPNAPLPGRVQAPRRPSQGQGSRPQNLGPPGSRAMAGRQPPRHTLRSGQGSSEYLANPAPYGHQNYGMSSHVARDHHRSGVVPGLPTSHQERPVSNSQVQTQRATYERLGAGHVPYWPTRSEEAPLYRHSMPHRSSPYEMTNRPQDLSWSQFTAAIPHAYANNPLSGPFPVFDPRLRQAGSPSIPPRHGSRQHSSGVPQRTQTHRHAQFQPPRDHPQTSLAYDHGSGITSRRSRSPAVAPVRTYPRMRREQRNQENDGDRSLMRREEANINARYGEEEQQRSTMDDTPPGIGRVERRMHE